MALYHIGAFGGSLHGSTKTTTFRRSKSGIVAYDRPDPHTSGRRAASESPATRNKAAMQLTGLSAEYLLPYLNVGGVDTKFGSVYNKLMRLCYDQQISDDFATSPYSLLYQANTVAEVGEKIAENIGQGGINFTNAWNLFLSAAWNPTTARRSDWAQDKCFVVGKFQAGISGYIVTKDGGNVTVTALDGRVHNVSIQVMSLKTPQAITVTGQTGTAIDVSAAAPTDEAAASMYYQKKAALLSIKVDGKKISMTFTDAFLCYKPA